MSVLRERVLHTRATVGGNAVVYHLEEVNPLLPTHWPVILCDTIYQHGWPRYTGKPLSWENYIIGCSRMDEASITSALRASLQLTGRSPIRLQPRTLHNREQAP